MWSESPVFAAAGCFSVPGRFRRRSQSTPRRSKAGRERDYISRHPAGHRRHLGTHRRAGPDRTGPGRGPRIPGLPLCSSGLAAFPAPRHELGRRRRGSPALGPVSAARQPLACPLCDGAGRGQGGGQGSAGLWRRWRSGCSECGCWQGSAAFRSCRRGGRVCQRCPVGRSYSAGDRE